MGLRKLVQLDAADLLEDLRVPPGNRLELLRGSRSGQYSIRINRPWRICFAWREGDAYDVEIPDYHQGSMGKKVLKPIHPGEVLLEDFLKPMGVSQYRLAKGISVPARRINEIVHGKRGVSADTALRLARFFGTSERFWLNLQSRYDIETGRDRLGDDLLREVEVLTKAG
jgi:addiction module HigA family antidote